MNKLSMKQLFMFIGGGIFLSMAMIQILLYVLIQDIHVFLIGIPFMVCALLWLYLMMQLFHKRLTHFTADLCMTLDAMIHGDGELKKVSDCETIFSRITHRLHRLYRIMQKNQCRIDEERKELQALISDISHQIKTPVSNIRMVTDTLSSKEISRGEQLDFLKDMQSQTDKLDFLFQALIKTSRLETGVILLEKRNECLYTTIAQAMSGIIYAAEKKEIHVHVDCMEQLYVSHDSKWTAEALFNLLDNAVKYTEVGGSICVTTKPWEMYVEIQVKDTGKGIPEKHHASIFQRFYREEDVHNLPGVGIGLYLAREIIIRQGGYIKVVSTQGTGSAFSIFLPVR